MTFRTVNAPIGWFGKTIRKTILRPAQAATLVMATTLLLPSPVDACAPGWTHYGVVSEDTPACFWVTAATEHNEYNESKYMPVELYNECSTDVTIEPMDGLCSGCKESFVMATGEVVSLVVSGQNNENTYTWRMEGKSPDRTEEGTIVLESISVIPSCPGCRTSGSSDTAPWVLLPLILALAFVLRPRRPAH